MQAVAMSQAEGGLEKATRDNLLRREEGARMTGNVLIVDDDQSMAETLAKAMIAPRLRRDLEDLGGRGARRCSTSRTSTSSSPTSTWRA